MRSTATLLTCLAVAAFAPAAAKATVYDVGPGHDYETPDAAPWRLIEPGDEVRIHWRPEPYRSRWSFSYRGREDAPIVCRGVRGPDGQRPVIDGSNALAPPGVVYTGGTRGIIKIGYCNVPEVHDPQWLVIEGLSFRGARPGHYSLGRGGLAEYLQTASGIFIERGSNIVIRDCEFTDCGNGFFAAWETRNLLVEGCYLHGNGGPNVHEHNSYTAGTNITFRGNRFGPLKDGCIGNALKDRSANLRVIGNWIEGGNRQLDLVDGEDDPSIVAAAGYRETWVVGNVLAEVEDFGNPQIVHFGGDSGDEPSYRRHLHLVGNTIVSTRRGKVTVLRLSTQAQTADVLNNVIYTTAPGGELAILDETGGVTLRGNWISEGYRRSHGPLAGHIDAAGNLGGETPGFVDFANWDLRLRASSPAVAAGQEVDWPQAIEWPLRISTREQDTVGRPLTRDLGAMPVAQ